VRINGWPNTKRRREIAEIYNRLSRVHERYRQTGRQTTDRQTDRRTGDSRYRSLKRIFSDVHNDFRRPPGAVAALPRFRRRDMSDFTYLLT